MDLATKAKLIDERLLDLDDKSLLYLFGNEPACSLEMTRTKKDLNLELQNFDTLILKIYKDFSESNHEEDVEADLPPLNTLSSNAACKHKSICNSSSITNEIDDLLPGSNEDFRNFRNLLQKSVSATLPPKNIVNLDKIDSIRTNLLLVKEIAKKQNCIKNVLNDIVRIRRLESELDFKASEDLILRYYEGRNRLFPALPPQ